MSNPTTTANSKPVKSAAKSGKRSPATVEKPKSIWEEPADTRRFAIFVELDGVLVDNRHLKYLIDPRDSKNEKGTIDFREFQNQSANCLPNLKLLEEIKQKVEEEDYRLVILTGRSDEYKAVTEQWLEDNEIPFHILYMKKSDDDRSDEDFKKSQLNTLSQRYHIDFAFENNPEASLVYEDRGAVVLTTPL